MAYIGKTPDYGAFEKQSLTADGSTTTFTLNYTVGSTSSILVSVSGVVQEPTSAYSLTGGGTQIVFSAAPEAGETVFVIFLGVAFETSTLATGAITGQTELAELAADDDLLLLYDTSAGSLKKIQKSNIATTLSYSLNSNLTGDGSTTAFTIGTSGRTANDILVTVNGVVFHPSDDYTLSGTTLTFTSPPVVSAEIRIRYLPA